MPDRRQNPFCNFCSRMQIFLKINFYANLIIVGTQQVIVIHIQTNECLCEGI